MPARSRSNGFTFLTAPNQLWGSSSTFLLLGNWKKRSAWPLAEACSGVVVIDFCSHQGGGGKSEDDQAALQA